MLIELDYMNNVLEVKLLGTTADLEQVVNYARPVPVHWEPFKSASERETPSVFEQVTLAHEVEDKYIRIQLHFELPAIEALGTSYDFVKLVIASSQYYSVKLRRLPETDGVSRLYFPDTWDPQKFVQGEILYQQVADYISVHHIEFPLDSLVLAPKARFWISTLLPCVIPTSQAVGFFTISVVLVDSKILGKHWVPPTIAELVGEIELLDLDLSDG